MLRYIHYKGENHKVTDAKDAEPKILLEYMYSLVQRTDTKEHVCIRTSKKTHRILFEWKRLKK